MDLTERLEYYLGLELSRREAVASRQVTCDVGPNQVYVEPTNACNNRCIMCVPDEKKGKIGFLDPLVWRRIIDSMASHDLRFPITMIGRGEPLLHKEIADLVAYASDHDVPCYLITNGALLDEAMVRRLLSAGIRKIQVSLHAHTPETYRAITLRDTYQQVRENLLRCIDLCQEPGQSCTVVTMAVRMEINQHEIDKFQAFWTPRVDRCFVTEVYSAQGDGGLAEEAKTRATVNDHHPGCVIPWYFLGVRYNGNITPCPFDFEEDFVVGNVSDATFDIMKTWNGADFQTLRRCHALGDFSEATARDYPCAQCEVPRTPGNCKGIDEYLECFQTAFARQFAPLLRHDKD